ncbi:MAG: hypothetical protein CVU43_07190 [Chloroflexi bacterium HGW-Chloroflexi-5]|jgi:hypothetical protein|nr:MAG: hypothetical protein CVU43_07190 [Chloroflexi bacterium HGW-Chloroflexi-5]
MTKNIKNNSINQFYTLHKQKITLILEFLLVLVFAYVEWRFKHRFYALFIIVFFVFTHIFKDRDHKDLIIPILIIFLIFNTLAFDSLLLFRRIDVPSIQHPKSYLKNLFTADTGLEVLPDSVQTMLTMMHAANIENYYLSPDYYGDGEIMQRIVESAWPIKLEESSQYIFISDQDNDLYQDCSFVANMKEINLVKCN